MNVFLPDVEHFMPQLRIWSRMMNLWLYMLYPMAWERNVTDICHLLAIQMSLLI